MGTSRTTPAEFGPRAVARIAAYLFAASGALSALTLPLPQLPGIDRLGVLTISAVAVAVGGLVYVLPWDRWPKDVSLLLLPVAFAIIGAGNYFGNARSYSYSVFFVVAFVWLGICHPRWTSLAFAPLAAAAYVAPILLHGEASRADQAAVALAIPVCVLVAEIIAWVVASERQNRGVAQALARSAARLGHHLHEASVCQSLVEEARVSMRSEHAVLYQFDPDTMTVTRVYATDVDVRVRRILERLPGTEIPEIPIELANGEPLLTEDTANSDRNEDLPLRFGVRSYIAMPVMARGMLVGVLSCWETSRQRKYRPDDVTLGAGLAGQASAAIQNTRLYEQTLVASRSDPLTGLGNRRSFRERLEAEVERSLRYRRDLSLILLDADQFKAVNDTFGHQTGDRTLQQIAGVLERHHRTEDTAFRIGGDEFALLLPETGPEGATILAGRVRRRIELAALGSERDAPLTISVGVSSLRTHGITADELFESADAALYEVKMTGGNAVALPPHASARPQFVRLGIDIDAVIDQRAIHPVYQPIFEIRTGSVMAFEAFCRLDPRFGYAPTPTLFRAAEAAGRIDFLDRLCRSIALASSGDLADGELLFLNVSPAALESELFSPSEITEACIASGLGPEAIVVEITEQERTPRSKRLVRSLRACREAGLKLALDDFGAAGADLDLLASLRFDYVKVDMTFVQGANGADVRTGVLRGLALVTREAGAYAIAEGIESVDDLRLVRELGFTGAQGFLLRRPSEIFDHAPRPMAPLDVSASSRRPQAASA